MIINVVELLSLFSINCTDTTFSSSYMPTGGNIFFVRSTY